MALSFLYRLFRRIVEAMPVHHMDTVAKDAEILVLRHQLSVLPNVKSPDPVSPGLTGR